MISINRLLPPHGIKIRFKVGGRLLSGCAAQLNLWDAEKRCHTVFVEMKGDYPEDLPVRVFFPGQVECWECVSAEDRARLRIEYHVRG
jgi:hypothetical protein